MLLDNAERTYIDAKVQNRNSKSHFVIAMLVENIFPLLRMDYNVGLFFYTYHFNGKIK